MESFHDFKHQFSMVVALLKHTNRSTNFTKNRKLRDEWVGDAELFSSASGDQPVQTFWCSNEVNESNWITRYTRPCDVQAHWKWRLTEEIEDVEKYTCALYEVHGQLWWQNAFSLWFLHFFLLHHYLPFTHNWQLWAIWESFSCQLCHIIKMLLVCDPLIPFIV